METIYLVTEHTDYGKGWGLYRNRMAFADKEKAQELADELNHKDHLFSLENSGPDYTDTFWELLYFVEEIPVIT